MSDDDPDDDKPLTEEDIARMAIELATAPVPKKKRLTDTGVTKEALRIHANVRELRADAEADLAESWDKIVEEGYWPGLNFNLENYCQLCMAEGQGWHALHGDSATARAAFDTARAAVPYYRRMQELGASAPMQRKKVYTDDEHSRTFGSARRFEPALFSLLFADDRISARAIADLVADERLTLAPKDDPFDVFVKHMSAVLRGEGANVSMADYGKVRPIETTYIVHAYREPLVAFARGNANAINAAVPLFERAYAERGRERYDHHIYGVGRLGQAMGFDVYGTALLKLASWGGISVSVDTRAHPGVFIRPAA